MVGRVAPVPPQPERGILGHHGLGPAEHLGMTAVDHGALRHGRDDVHEGGHQQRQQQRGGQDARHVGVQLAQQTLEHPVQGQGQAHGHDGRAEHDHAAAHLGAEQAQRRQRQQEERAGTAEDHPHEAQQAQGRGLVPGMEIGQHGQQAKVLHFGKGLPRRRIDEGQRPAAARDLGLLHVQGKLVGDGLQQFARQEEGAHPQPEEDEDPGAAQPLAQTVHLTGTRPARGHEQGAEAEEQGAAQRGQGVGQRAQQQEVAAAARGHDQAHEGQQADIVAGQIGEDRMPLLRPPGDDAGNAQQHHPLPAQGIAQTQVLLGQRAAPEAFGRGQAGTDDELFQDQLGQEHVAHGPAGRGQGHEQGEEQGHEVRVIVSQQGTGQETRRQAGQQARRHTGLHAAQGPDPGVDDDGHEAGEQRREPESHRRGIGPQQIGHAAQHDGHGVPHRMAETFGTGHPVVGIVRGQQPFRAQTVLRVLPAGPFQHAQGKGQAQGHQAPEQAVQPEGAVLSGKIDGDRFVRHACSPLWQRVFRQKKGRIPGIRRNVRGKGEKPGALPRGQPLPSKTILRLSGAGPRTSGARCRPCRRRTPPAPSRRCPRRRAAPRGPGSPRCRHRPDAGPPAPAAAARA